MNSQLSEYLLTSIAKPAYIDKWSGCVQTIDKDGKKFPIAQPLAGRDCERIPTFPVEMVPDAKFKGILYFEDKGVTRNNQQFTSAYSYRSDLRLVCWLNNKKIAADLSLSGLNAYAVADIMRLLQRNFYGNDIFKVIRVNVSGIAAQNADIFTKYDYDDKITAYLQGDYTFFAIDMAVSFVMHKKCLLNLETGAPVIC